MINAASPLSVIDVRSLSFSYNGNLVLENVNFSVKKGEFLGVFGPNGGGKTTLLRLIMGFLEPQKGAIRVLGNPPQEARPSIGYVPQFSRYDKKFPISVLEIVMMGCLAEMPWWGGYSHAAREKSLSLLEKVGLADLKDRSFGTLSGGQAQRALIARALVDDPEILLLDEPTANIDPLAERDIHKLLHTLRNGTMTILMVTHDLQSITGEATRLLCVQRDVQEYTTREICDHFNVGLYHSRTFGPKRGAE